MVSIRLTSGTHPPGRILRPDTGQLHQAQQAYRKGNDGDARREPNSVCVLVLVGNERAADAKRSQQNTDDESWLPA